MLRSPVCYDIMVRVHVEELGLSEFWGSLSEEETQNGSIEIKMKSSKLPHSL